MNHNLYNQQFYDKQSTESFQSAVTVITALKRVLCYEINSIVDFGCGVGPWLAAANELGVENVYGTDGNYVPRDRLLIPEDSFFPNDLSKPESIKLPVSRFDLTITLEVAEHLPESSAKPFVKKLCDSSDVVLFSAAIPYQGGHGHVNENWPEYWAALFAEFDFVPFDIIRPAVWNDDKVCWWYKQNILLFVNKHRATNVLPGYSPSPVEQLSIVHPEQYLVSIQRSNHDITRSVSQDINYWSSLTHLKELPNPNYGTEFSYVEEEKTEINAIQDLYQTDSYQNSAVIQDALSGIVKKSRKPLIKTELELIEGRAPDFLCIGVQKSATTWLYRVLQQQADVWVPPIKELNFFNALYFEKSSAYSGAWRRETALNRLNKALTNNKNINQGWLDLLVHLTSENADSAGSAWYKKLFSFAPKHKLVGDITTEYAMLPFEGIKHVYAMNPKLKIVLLLRSPVERAISHLKMIKLNEPALTTKCLIEISKQQSVFERGNYPKIIDNWLAVFPKEQVMISFYEEISSNSTYYIEQLSSFLGVNIDEGKLKNKIVHQSKVTLENEDTIRLSLEDDLSSIYQTMFIRFPELETLWCGTVEHKIMNGLVC
ncbi:MAG: hypothetical protein ACJA0H_002144 [Francisellaceae bacterium]